MKYFCLEFDVTVSHKPGMSKLTRRGIEARIEHKKEWVILFIELLRNPISEIRINAILGKSISCSAKALLLQLKERNFLFQFSAENENTALYFFHNSRPSWGKVVSFEQEGEETKYLKHPVLESISLYSALKNRYSCSETTSTELSIENISILLTLTYGFFNAKDGIQRRAVPAAGGLYPLDIYLSLPSGENLENFLYYPVESQIKKISLCSGSIRSLCNGQEIVGAAKGLVTYVYNVSKNTSKYGPRGLQFALIECGHAAQNLLVGAAGIGIGTRCIGAVDFKAANVSFCLNNDQVPIYAVALY